jgi:RsiW-degrading membrane proteinase PrsW (M82 family)
MQSCPRCGTRTGPDARICPACGLSLFPFQEPAANPMPGMVSLEAPGVSSPNGTTPQATPPSQATPSHAAAQPTGERWGPGSWETETPLVSDAPAAAPGPDIASQPTTLREYSSGTVQRPYPVYQPPTGPAGAALPYPAYPPRPGYPPYPAYPGARGYPYGWYPPARPPRAPGETYHKVLSILAVIGVSLLLLSGLGGLTLTALVALAGNGQDLSGINLLVMGTIAALVGGGAGLYHAIRALNHRPSAQFSLPSFWLLLALIVVILGAGIALFATNQPTGSVALIEPLVLLSGIVPALTVLALGLQRLWPTVSWRRAWLALTCGATLAVGAASVLELVLALVLLGVASLNVDLSNLNPNGSFGTVALLILVAVIAPLVEETTKQISGFFLLSRMKGPQEAFIIGLASGVGFAILETAGYIGTAQADWAGIALGRVGAGLLHGMGAAMAGVGWYYLFRGKGMRGRWRIGFGCLAYAYAQHAVFNGSQLLLGFAQPLQDWHVDFFDIRLDITSVCAGGLYVIIVGIMLLVIRWLRRSAPGTSSASSGGMRAPTISTATYSSRSAGNSVAGYSPSAAATDTLGIREPGSKEPGGYV